MPEHYSSIGEAVGVAMQHNIRLAHSPTPDPTLQVRYFPPPSADPYSMPGMIARLEVTADPQNVAGILEETTSALVGPLPQLTELVAATADWTRARLNFDDPDNNPAFDLWTRLASAHYGWPSPKRTWSTPSPASPLYRPNPATPGTTPWSR